jgi:hypothetical protein
MPRVRRRRPELADRHDNPPPCIGAGGIAAPAHLVDHRARLPGCLVAVLLNPPMGCAGNIESRGWHGSIFIRCGTDDGRSVRPKGFPLIKIRAMLAQIVLSRRT